MHQQNLDQAKGFGGTSCHGILIYDSAGLPALTPDLLFWLLTDMASLEQLASYGMPLQNSGFTGGSDFWVKPITANGACLSKALGHI